VILSVDKLTFNRENHGENTLTLKVKDNANNSSICQAIMPVEKSIFAKNTEIIYGLNVWPTLQVIALIYHITS
jgi:hypothetical protein